MTINEDFRKMLEDRIEEIREEAEKRNLFEAKNETNNTSETNGYVKEIKHFGEYDFSYYPETFEPEEMTATLENKVTELINKVNELANIVNTFLPVHLMQELDDEI